MDNETMPVDVAYSFFDDNRTRLEFVGRLDEQSFAVGPFWISGGFCASSQFNNGFFYGHLDEDGKMTGAKFFSKSILPKFTH